MLTNVLKKHPYLEEIVKYLDRDYKEFKFECRPRMYPSSYCTLESEGISTWAYMVKEWELRLEENLPIGTSWSEK